MLHIDEEDAVGVKMGWFSFSRRSFVVVMGNAVLMKQGKPYVSAGSCSCGLFVFSRPVPF